MRPLAGALFLVVLLHGMAAAASPVLLLEIWINGRSDHRVARVRCENDAIFANPADLAAAGLILAPREARSDIALTALDGITATIDRTNQRLMIRASDARLAVQSIELRPSQSDGERSTAAKGAILNYDLSAQVSDAIHLGRTATGGGNFGVTLFAPGLFFTATGFATAQPSATQGARLDTAIEFDDPSLPRRIILGDAISGSLAWSRSLRFGGIEIASDYDLRPDLVTFPLPQYFGHASVPETVDVLIGSANVFETTVDQGPFALHDLPVLTGGGAATVVTTDILGRQTTQTVSLYTTTQLLASGLNDYSADLGFLRYGYGEQSFDYRVPMASAVYRHGFDAFTLEIHGEAANGVALGGADVAFSLGSFGALSAASAVSTGANGGGALAAVNAEGRIGALDAFASLQTTTLRYLDIAGLEDGPPARVRAQIGASAALPLGSLAVSWVKETAAAQAASDDLLASYSLTAGNGWLVGLSGLRDMSGHQWAAQLFLSIPTDRGIASVSASAGSAAPSLLAQFGSPANPDGGFGYNLSAETDGGDRHYEGDATWIAQHGTLDASLALDNGEVTMRGDASGALVAVGGDLFATRTPQGAFALVETGQPDVRIYRDNRDVAVSDDDGEALLPGLVPYTANRIAVEPRDYPMTSVVASTEQDVVPQRNSAVIVDLAPHQNRPAVVIVRLPDGRSPPPGTAVTTGESQILITGLGGEVYIPDLAARATLSLVIDGRPCVVRVAPPVLQTAIIPRIGPLVCRTETAA